MKILFKAINKKYSMIDCEDINEFFTILVDIQKNKSELTNVYDIDSSENEEISIHNEDCDYFEFSWKDIPFDGLDYPNKIHCLRVSKIELEKYFNSEIKIIVLPIEEGS